jgi:hypothetical protein
LQLQICLYGLRQSGYHWHSHLDSTLTNLGLTKTTADPCLYRSEDGNTAVLIYVDDIILVGTTPMIDKLKKGIGDKMDFTDDGSINWFLSVKYEYNIERGTLNMSQSAYAREILANARMENCKPAATPMTDRLYSSDEPLSNDDAKAMALVPFRRLPVVGGLMYLTTCTRPDLCYAVNQLCRHMASPRPEHWAALKRTLRYLQGTKNLGLCFNRQEHTSITGYSDADWAGDIQTRKSTSGFCFIMAGACITFRVMTQRCVALSTYIYS